MNATVTLEAVDQDRRLVGATDSDAVRPFHVSFADAELAEMRSRINPCQTGAR